MTTCDSYFRELRANGVGTESCATKSLTPEDEEKLWATGVLSTDTPQGLLNAVFFYNGKNYLLRGGAEHRGLNLSQIQRNVSQEGRVRYTYRKRVQESEW